MSKKAIVTSSGIGPPNIHFYSGNIAEKTVKKRNKLFLWIEKKISGKNKK